MNTQKMSLKEETIQVILQGTKTDGKFMPTEVRKLASTLWGDTSAMTKLGQKLAVEGFLEHRDGNKTDLFVSSEILRFLAEKKRLPEEETTREARGSASGGAVRDDGFTTVRKPEKANKHAPSKGEYLVERIARALADGTSDGSVSAKDMAATNAEFSEELRLNGYGSKFGLAKFLYDFNVTVKDSGTGKYFLREKFQRPRTIVEAAKMAQSVPLPQVALKRREEDFPYISGAHTQPSAVPLPEGWASKASPIQSHWEPDAVQKAQKENEALEEQIALAELELKKQTDLAELKLKKQNLEERLAALMAKLGNKP